MRFLKRGVDNNPSEAQRGMNIASYNEEKDDGMEEGGDAIRGGYGYGTNRRGHGVDTNRRGHEGVDTNRRGYGVGTNKRGHGGPGGAMRDSVEVVPGRNPNCTSLSEVEADRKLNQKQEDLEETEAYLDEQNMNMMPRNHATAVTRLYPQRTRKVLNEGLEEMEAYLNEQDEKLNKWQSNYTTKVDIKKLSDDVKEELYDEKLNETVKKTDGLGKHTSDQQRTWSTKAVFVITESVMVIVFVCMCIVFCAKAAKKYFY